MQLKKIKKYLQKSAQSAPACYVSRLEKELEYWKKLSKGFIDDGYSFINDKQEIMTIMADRLNKKSTQKFICYTVYELNAFAGRKDDEGLDSIRKFIEDIYYNYELISPFFDKPQHNLFDKKALDKCLGLFDDFRDKCVALALMETFSTNESDEPEKQLLKEMKNEWLNEKKDAKNRLIAALDSMNMKANSLEEFAIANE